MKKHVYFRSELEKPQHFHLGNVIGGRGIVDSVGYADVDYQLTEKEIDDLRTLICKGTRMQTYNAFDRHANAGFKDLPVLSLMDRVQFENGSWRYTAAQDYSLELNEIRRLFRVN